MNNSIGYKCSSPRIDLISFDLETDRREIATTSYFDTSYSDDEKKQYKVNSFESNTGKFYHQGNDCIYLKAYKSVDKLVANIGETLNYKIIIENLSNKSISNVILQDNLPAGTTYIINSLRLNGYIQSGAYPQLGFLIQKINSNSSVIITFSVSINLAKPFPESLSNFSTIINGEQSINTNIVNTKINSLYYEKDCYKEDQYKYENDYKQNCYIDDYYKKEINYRENYYSDDYYKYERNYRENYENENEEKVQLNNYYEDNCSNLQYSSRKEERGLDLVNYFQNIESEYKQEYYLNLSISKVADKDCVEFNDIITYKISVRNDESIHFFDVQLIENRDSALEFVKGSLVFNNKKINVSTLEDLISIGDLQPEEECIIEYKMRVKSTTKDGYLKNSVYAKYTYCPDKKNLMIGETKIYEMKTKVKAMSYKLYNFNKCVGVHEKDIEDMSIEEIDIDVTINDKYVLKGYRLKDNEGNILSGYQLKFFGAIDVLVQYSILNSELEVRLKAWSIPFSSYIILPSDYKEGDIIEIQSKIDNIAADLLNFEEINLGANILFYV